MEELNNFINNIKTFEFYTQTSGKYKLLNLRGFDENLILQLKGNAFREIKQHLNKSFAISELEELEKELDNVKHSIQNNYKIKVLKEGLGNSYKITEVKYRKIPSSLKDKFLEYDFIEHINSYLPKVFANFFINHIPNVDYYPTLADELWDSLGLRIYYVKTLLREIKELRQIRISVEPQKLEAIKEYSSFNKLSLNAQQYVIETLFNNSIKLPLKVSIIMELKIFDELLTMKKTKWEIYKIIAKLINNGKNYVGIQKHILAYNNPNHSQRDIYNAHENSKKVKKELLK